MEDTERYEVFTAANPAWTSTHERILIENRLSELQADLVISLSGNNDVHWGVLGRDALWLRTYADELFHHLLLQSFNRTGFPSWEDVVEVKNNVIPCEELAARTAKNARLSAYALAMNGSDYLFALQPMLASTGKQLTRRESARLQQFSRETTHAIHRFDKKHYFMECLSSIDADMRGLTSGNFRFLDLSNVFDGLPAGTEVFLDAYHFGDRGNELIAERIFESLFQ